MQGISLIELVVASALMIFVSAVLAELMLLIVAATSRLTNQVDGFTAAKFAIARIKNDVRVASGFGSSTNGHTLVLLLPIFYLDPQNDPASPSYNSSLPQNPRNGIPLKALNPDIDKSFDTVTYQLTADLNNPGEYMLQISLTPGARDYPTEISYRPAINPPQTILKGIIGPNNSASGTVEPDVFSFLENKNVEWKYFSFLGNNPDGVRIDLEVSRPTDAVQANSLFQKRFAVHGEVFLRNNERVKI